MNYPVAIESEKGRAFGIVVPDLPGCFSAGDSMDEALSNAREAILMHLEALIDGGETIPKPSPIEVLSLRREFRGRVWAMIGVDLSQLEGKTCRVNITLPARVLRRIDAAASKRGESRSGFIASASLQLAVK